MKVNKTKETKETYRLESSDSAAGNVIDVETALVDELALGTAVADLGHPVVAAVAGLEEHDGGPVVGQVLDEAARRARRLGREVVLADLHGQVERVAADDLVQVGRVADARVDEGVDAVDDELRAREAQHVLGCRAACEQGHGGEEMHLCFFSCLFVFSKHLSFSTSKVR